MSNFSNLRQSIFQTRNTLFETPRGEKRCEVKKQLYKLFDELRDSLNSVLQDFESQGKITYLPDWKVYKCGEVYLRVSTWGSLRRTEWTIYQIQISETPEGGQWFGNLDSDKYYIGLNMSKKTKEITEEIRLITR